jgi:hypothetical protein
LMLTPALAVWKASMVSRTSPGLLNQKNP